MASMKRELRDYIKLAQLAGWTVRPAGKRNPHIQWITAEGQLVHTSAATVSDVKIEAEKKMVRSCLFQHGILLKSTESPRSRLTLARVAGHGHGIRTDEVTE